MKQLVNSAFVWCEELCRSWRMLITSSSICLILYIIVQPLVVIQLQWVQETSRKPWMQHVELTNQMFALSYRKMALVARVWL